jgi:hypothetical protein
VSQSLTTEQADALWALRVSILTGEYDDGTPYDFTICANYYLYSDVIPDPSVLDPYLAASDGLFFEPDSTPTPTATETSTPTPTPAPGLTVELSMPAQSFSAGDPCNLVLDATNTGTTTLTGLPLFVILESMGRFWFAPSWVGEEDGIDSYSMDFPAGLTHLDIIAAFTWPAGLGAGTATFWAAATDSEVTRLESSVSNRSFHWDSAN